YAGGVYLNATTPGAAIVAVNDLLARGATPATETSWVPTTLPPLSTNSILNVKVFSASVLLAMVPEIVVLASVAVNSLNVTRVGRLVISPLYFRAESTARAAESL